MTKTAVITGAGSGVGQAVAIALAKQGWRVALLGRHPETLNQTLSQCESVTGQSLVCPCDIGEVKAVQTVADRILAQFK